MMNNMANHPTRPGPAAAPGPGPRDRDDPVLPARTGEDADEGWGDRSDTDDDERLRGERPPHWESG